MRYSIPLFSQGIRKAERIAIAMEARGFTGTKERTYYQTTHVVAKDWAYAFLLLIVVITLMVVE